MLCTSTLLLVAMSAGCVLRSTPRQCWNAGNGQSSGMTYAVPLSRFFAWPRNRQWYSESTA
eukprot:5832700-Prymnesium_polylepis.2